MVLVRHAWGEGEEGTAAAMQQTPARQPSQDVALPRRQRPRSISPRKILSSSTTTSNTTSNNNHNNNHNNNNNSDHSINSVSIRDVNWRWLMGGIVVALIATRCILSACPRRGQDVGSSSGLQQVGPSPLETFSAKYPHYSHHRQLASLLKLISGENTSGKATTVAIVGPDDELGRELLRVLTAGQTTQTVDGNVWRERSANDGPSWRQWVIGQIKPVLEQSPTAVIVMENLPEEQGALDPLHHCFNDKMPLLVAGSHVSCQHATFIFVIKDWPTATSAGVAELAAACSDTSPSRCSQLLSGEPMHALMTSPAAREKNHLIDTRATQRRVRWILPAMHSSRGDGDQGVTMKR